MYILYYYYSIIFYMNFNIYMREQRTIYYITKYSIYILLGYYIT